MNKLKPAIGFLGIGLVCAALFQNCSGAKFVSDNLSLDQYSLSSISPSASPSISTSSSPSPQSSASPTPNAQCTNNAMNVYSWDNSNQDPMQVGFAPQMSALLGVVSITNTGTTSATNPYAGSAISSGSAWRINSVTSLASAGSTATKTTTYMNKLVSHEGKLECFFGPVIQPGGCQVLSTEAKLSYNDVGVGLNGVDGFVGYLSCPVKYIACRVLNSNYSVEFLGANREKLTVPQNRPFVIKRGCN